MCLLSTGLVVAADIVEWHLLGKHLHGCIHEATKQFALGIVEKREHVAIEEDHIPGLTIRDLHQFAQHILMLMDVIHHHKRDIWLALVKRAKRGKWYPVSGRCRNVAIVHMDAPMLEHLLRIDTVTVLGAGTQARQTDGVDTSFALDTDSCVVKTGAHGSIKRGTIGRCCLHPSHRSTVGHPHDGSLGLRNILQIGSMQYLDSMDASKRQHQEGCQHY